MHRKIVGTAISTVSRGKSVYCESSLLGISLERFFNGFFKRHRFFKYIWHFFDSYSVFTNSRLNVCRNELIILDRPYIKLLLLIYFQNLKYIYL